MKLHLPKLLRNSVLACITAVAGIATTTVGTATFTGGVVAFALTAPQAMAEYQWAGGSGTKASADWAVAENWNLGEGIQIAGTGPGTADSALWDVINVSGGADGVTIGGASDRVGLEGWNLRMNLDSHATVYAITNKLQKDQYTNHAISVNNGSTLDLSVKSSGHFNPATFTVGANSNFTLRMDGNKNQGALTINLTDPTAVMKFASTTSDVRTLSGPITVVSSVLADVQEGTWSVRDLGLYTENMTLSNLTLDLGEGWVKTDTEITAENYNSMGSMYNLIQGDDGQYKVVYSKAAVPIWTGGALSWGTGTSFSNSVSYANGQPVKFTTADATVTLAADITANTITVDENIKVGISGAHTLAANSVKLGAGAQLSIGQTNGVNLGAVAMGEGAQLNIATGTETTIADVLGGAIGVTNGTILNFVGTEFNATAVVVDNATINTGEAYFGKDVTLKNNAVLNYTGSTSELFDWGQNQTLSVLSGSRMELGTRRISLEGTDTLILDNGHINGAGGQINNADEQDRSLIDFCKNTIQLISDGESSIEGPIRVTNSSTATLTVNSGTLTLGMLKGGGASLVKVGDGNLKITGGANYTGTTTVTEGELIFASTSSTGKGAITIGEDGTLTIADGASQSIGTTITGSGTLNVNGELLIDASTFNVLAASGLEYSDGANGFTQGMLVANVGTVNFGENGSVKLSDEEIYTVADVKILDGKLLVGEGGDVYYVNTEVTYNADKMAEVQRFYMVSGAKFYTDDASVLAKTDVVDATSTLYFDKAGTIVSGDNSSFKGSVVITGGTTVQASHFAALGQDYRNNKNRSVTLESGATYDLNGTDGYYHYILQEGATLANTGEAKSPDQHMQPPNVELQGNATVNAASDFGMRYAAGQTASETLNLGGHTLTKTGAGTFFLYATAVSAGTIDVKEGTLRSVNASGIAAVDLKIQSGATQSFDARDAATERSWKSLTAYAGESAGAVTLEQGANLNLKIENGTNAEVLINKTGAGALTMKGVTTLAAGVTVSAGTLTLNGATTLSGLLTVADGATLVVSDGVTVTLGSLTGFESSSSSTAVPATNKLVTLSDSYKVLDKADGATVTNLSSVTYNGTAYQISETGYISPADTNVYYAVEAGEDKVVTVGGDSATTGTAEANEFYVGESGTLLIAGNISETVTSSNVLMSTVGSGTVELGAAATVVGSTSFAGTLQVNGVTLSLGNGQESYGNISSLEKLVLNGGSVYYNAKGGTLKALEVKESATLDIHDMKENETLAIGTVTVAEGKTFTQQTLWKNKINIDVLTGAGDAKFKGMTGGGETKANALTIGSLAGFSGQLSVVPNSNIDNKYTVVINTGATGANFKGLAIDADGRTPSAFSMTFNVQGATTVGTITAGASPTNINIASGASLNNFTKAGEGSINISGAGTYHVGNSLTLAEGISLVEGWSGTVTATNANVTGTVDASALTNGSSSLAISGLTVADGAALTLGGKVSLGGTVSVAESIDANGTLTFGSDLKLSVAEDMITNGTSDGEMVITLITGAGASAVGSMSSAMLSDELLALGVADSWAFNADGTISFTSVNVNPKLVWGGGDGNLSDSSKYANDATYEVGSDITFGAVTDGNADTITVAASDSIANATVQTGGNYVFNGTKLNVTGNLSIATGAAVDAQAGLSVGGSLESAGTLKATTIDGKGNVSITGGSLELNGSLANTGTKSISGAELKGNWSATGVSLGTGVTVGEGGTITLTNTTLAGTVTNKGNLTLSGTVNISPSAGFQTQVSGVQYSDGANGIKYADVTYTIVTGTGTTTVDNATWQVDGVAKGTYTDGKLNVRGAQQGTLYWANSGDVTYTGNMTGATGIALNGGSVALNASLADSMTDGIQVSKAGTVTLGSDATLAATQVNGATAANKVTLDGTGTYDLGSDTALGAGIGLADSWKGTVQVDATSVTAGADLSALGNASSTIGIDGALTLGTAETAATLNAGSSALALESLTMGNVASSITAGSLVLGDSFALNLTDVLKASQEIAGNTLITLTTALSDADKDKLTGTWKGTGVAGLYDYETKWNGNALVLTGKQNAIIWEGETGSGEGGDESDFGGNNQTWDSNTTGTGDNVAFTGNCAGGDGKVNVVGDDTTGAVKVGSVTVTDIEGTGTSYTFMGGSINAEGNLVVGTVDEEEKETSGELIISNNSTFKGSATVAGSSSLAVSGVTTPDDDGNSTTTEASLTVGSLTAAGSVTVGDSGSLTVTGDLTIESASEEEGSKGGSLSISTAGSLAAGVTTTTDAEGNTTQTPTGNLSVDKITITGTLQHNAATLVTVGHLEKDVVIDLEDDSTLKDIKAGTFNLMSVLGAVTDVTLDADDLQAILAKGLGCKGLSSTGGATTFSLRRTLAPVPTDIYLEVRELTAKELIWDTNEGSSTGGLNIVDKVNDDGFIVLKDNSILDTIQTVDVAEDTTIDLRSTDGTVNINGLTGEKNLTIVGNDDEVNVTTGAKYDGALVLSDVAASVSGQYGNIPAALGSGTLVKNGVQVGEDATAELDVKDSKVVLDGGSLSGDSKMDRGALVVMSSNAAIVAGNIEVETGDSLTVSGTAIAIVGNATDNMVLDVKSTGTHVIADLGKVNGNEGEVAIVDEANKSIAVMDKYFSGMRLEGGKVLADRNTSYYTDKAGAAASANGAAGLAMADAVLVKLNPQATAPQGDLAGVLNMLDTATGAAADELGASLAGASTAVLGMAVSGDVDRQLQAIRNRTTTMGVDQSVANADMPYFNAWINAEGDRSELSESGTESGYELSSWGGTVGFDVDLCPTFTAGMALTAMYGDIDTTGADKASGNIDTYYVTAFARYAPSAWTHTFVATVGMSDISLDRHVAGAEVEGETDGLSFGLMYEVGRVFALDEDGSTCLQPVFNVTWKHTAIDAYTEDGSDLALELDEQTLDTVTFGLGARLQTVVGESIYNRTSILEARVLAKADVGDRSGSADVALSALPGTKASVDSAEMGAFGLEAGAGLTIPVGDEGGSIFMDASVELRSDYTNVNGTVGYRINF